MEQPSLIIQFRPHHLINPIFLGQFHRLYIFAALLKLDFIFIEILGTYRFDLGKFVIISFLDGFSMGRGMICNFGHVCSKFLSLSFHIRFQYFFGVAQYLLQVDQRLLNFHFAFFNTSFDEDFEIVDFG